MEPNELLRAVGVVLSSLASESNGDPIPGEWKKEMEALRSLTFADMLKPSPSNLNAVARASALGSRLTSVAEALRILSSSFEDEVKSTRRCLKKLKRMCGLASVPNNIMVQIFECVVSPDDSDSREYLHSRRACASTRLSHISRHFRDLVLATPQLWNQINVHKDSCSELTEACIQRSGALPLDIHLSAYAGTSTSIPEPQGYFDARLQVLSQVHRWRNFTFHVLLKPWIFRRGEIPVSKFPPIFKASTTYGSPDTYFSVPLLQRLSIEKGPEILPHVVERLASYFLWQTPNLRALKVAHYFPYHLPELSSISVLDITSATSGVEFDFRRLLIALPRMRALEDFCVRFEEYEEWLRRAPEHVVFNSTALASVSRFSLRFKTKFFPEPKYINPQRAFCAALFFPNATQLHIQFHGLQLGKDNRTLRAGVPASIDEFFDLADKQFPRVSSLHFDLGGSMLCDSSGAKKIVSPAIPLHRLPQLKHLIIQSNFRLSIGKENDVPSECPLPALQEISLYIPKIKSSVRQ